jgi:Tfp pilus assembly protein PilX
MPAILVVVAALLLVTAVAGLRRAEQQVLEAIARGDTPATTTAASRAVQRLLRTGVIRERNGRLETDTDRAVTYNAQRRQQGILLAVVTVSLLITSAVVTKMVLDRHAHGVASPAAATER